MSGNVYAFATGGATEQFNDADILFRAETRQRRSWKRAQTLVFCDELPSGNEPIDVGPLQGGSLYYQFKRLGTIPALHVA